MDVRVRTLYAGGAYRTCEVVGFEVVNAEGEVLGFGESENEARNEAQTKMSRREIQE